MRPPRIEIHTSSLFILLTITIDLITVFVIFNTVLPFIMMLGLIGVIFISSWHNIILHGWRLRSTAIVAICAQKNGEWLITSKSQMLKQEQGDLATLSANSTLTSLFLILRFITKKKKNTVIIGVDSIDHSSWRHLRAWLRH